MSVSDLAEFHTGGSDGNADDITSPGAFVARRCRALVQNHVVRRIGSSLVSSFSASEARSFATTLSDTLSRGQVRNVLRAARNLFDAVGGRNNPFVEVLEEFSLPARRALPLSIPSAEEVPIILSMSGRLAGHVDGPTVAAEWRRYNLMLRVLVSGALRLSELFALPWDDVLFEHGAIMISQRVDALGVLAPPRRGAAFRRVDLPPDLIQGLSEWRTLCPVSRPDNPALSVLGWTPKRSLVFPTVTGGAQRFSTFLRRCWIPLLEQADLREPDTGKREFKSGSRVTIMPSGC